MEEITDEMFKEMMEDEEYSETHCMDCDGKKTNRSADICFECAKKVAKEFGKTITQEEYDRG